MDEVTEAKKIQNSLHYYQRLLKALNDNPNEDSDPDGVFNFYLEAEKILKRKAENPNPRENREASTKASKKDVFDELSRE
ncbi:MAG: hypothetical protein R2879_22010 [Saprospiraceae bacterium]